MDVSGFTDQGSLAHDNLVGGEFPVETRPVTIAAGQDLTRGAALGRIDGGDWVHVDKNAVNGSKVMRGVLVSPIDTTGGAATATVYVSGTFNETALNFAAGTTVDDVREEKSDTIFLHKNLGV